MTSACFLKTSLAPLVLVALVPSLISVADARPGRAFALGFLMGLVGLTTAFAWVPSTIGRFESLPTSMTLPFFTLFVAYHALEIALFVAGACWLQRRKARGSGKVYIGAPSPVTSILVASWWVLLEWSFPKIIPWYLGDTLGGSPLLRQAADLGGVYGLSFLIVLTNALLATAIVQRKRVPLGWMPPLAVTAVATALWSTYGAMRIEAVDGPRSKVGNSVGIAVVQGGLQSGRHDLEAANEEAWSTYVRMTEQNIADEAGSAEGVRGDEINLLIWPETVLRIYLRQNNQYRARIVDLVQRLQRPLLVGSLDLPGEGPGEFNSAYLFNPGAVQISEDLVRHGTQVYHKLRLLPFGEYVPGINWLPTLQRWRTTGQFIPGDAPALRPMSFVVRDASPASHGPQTDEPLAARGTTFAASICFEAIFPGAFNQLVRDGAEFLVNITDDGWLGNTAGPYQHLNATTLRAVETRRWLVRASNSGVSAFVDPTGRIAASLPLDAKGVLRRRIQTLQACSLYVRLGNWPVALSFGCVLVFAISRRLKRGV